jgi:hypothetical protein
MTKKVIRRTKKTEETKVDGDELLFSEPIKEEESKKEEETPKRFVGFHPITNEKMFV